MNEIDLVGRVLDGRYRVVSRLGAGAMATVYLAHQESLDRDVVVKVPDAALAADEEFLLRFQQEIRSLTKLRHPRIVSILEAGEIDGVPYAVMDYLEGGSLKDRMSGARTAGEPGGPEKVMEWLPAIAEALDFVHGKGVVHRDVKPANLLFDGEGNPFLSDFGIAKALGPMDSEITRTGSTVGTALYMAPEQGLDATITGAADQYALGVIAFETICGRPPHTGGTSPVIMVKKLTEDAPAVGELAPDLPERAAAAVMRALARVPEKRFPSCSDFVNAFAAGLSGVAGGGASPVPVEADAVVEGESRFDDFTGNLDVPVAEPLDEAEPLEEEEEEEEVPGGPNEVTGTFLAPAAGPPAVETPTEKPGEATGTFVAPSPRTQGETPVERKSHRGILIAGVAAAILAACLLIFSGGGGPEQEQEEETPPPEILLTFEQAPADGALLAEPLVEVAGRIRGDPGAWVEVAGRRADLDAGGTFTATVILEEGENVIGYRVLRAEGEVVETRQVTVVVDTHAPGILLDTPPEGGLVRDTRLTLAGRIVDLHPGPVTVAGVQARQGTDGTFLVEVSLAEGRNELEVRARDAAGNETVMVRSVTLDSRPPVISPDPLPEATAGSAIAVTGTLDEYGCMVTVSGVPAALVDTRFVCVIPLVAGPNPIEIVAVDGAGNRAVASASVLMDDQPPTVRLDPLPEVTGEARLAVTGEVDQEGCRITVNGVDAEVEGTRFTCEIPLAAGENRVRATAVDRVGLTASAEATVVLDDDPPTVRLDDLPEAVREPRIAVGGEVGEEGCRVTINGAEAEVDGTRFTGDAALVPGGNVIEVVVTDRAGRRISQSVAVLLDDRPPEVRIDAMGVVATESRVTVTGEVDEEGCRVTVNGVEAAVEGRRYSCEVPLTVGDNAIEVVAIDRVGHRASASAVVRLEEEPLVVQIDALPAVTTERGITVTGSVNREGCRITVNGVAARIGGTKYKCFLDLAIGENEIEVTAVDPSGLRASTRATVRRDPAPGPPPQVRIDPLRVVSNSPRVTVTGVVDRDGCRVTVNGQPATVTGRRYSLEITLPPGRSEIVVVATDPSGRAGRSRATVTARGRGPGAPAVVGYRYPKATLDGFRRLLSRPEWQIASPVNNQQGLLEAVHSGTGLTFVLIPGGRFLRGSDGTEFGRFEDEGPVREVRVRPFLLCKTECTQAAWDRLGGIDRRSRHDSTYPIDRVSWTSARAWCDPAGLRLPSEAEWEYACGAGSEEPFCFGNDKARLGEYAWYAGNNDGGIRPVGQKRPNGWGLHDMHGNVFEWCEDVWNYTYEGAPDDGSARGAPYAKARVYRGGCWDSEAVACRSAARSGEVPGRNEKSIGFRPALSLP